MRILNKIVHSLRDERTSMDETLNGNSVQSHQRTAHQHTKLARLQTLLVAIR